MTAIELDIESYAFPTSLLDGCESALLLFASGRMGAADGYWLQEAGIDDVWCVDHDPATLVPFAAAYPAEWRYLEADAFAFFPDRVFDLVSVDAPSQFAPHLLTWLPRWCGFASRFVTATVFRHCFIGEPSLDELEPAPDGWRYRDLIHRSEFRGGVYWLVMERV